MIGLDCLALFQRSFPGAVVMREREIDYIFIPALPVVTSLSDEKTAVDALLCPMQHPSGYMTRLFLESPFLGAGKSNNWTTHRILERQWHTWSWQGIQPTDAPLQILAAHLRALK
jgi:hypothetical protein